MAETEQQELSLHMLDLRLDSRRLTELARALHLPLNQADDGYLCHCALGELFGDDAPGPFSIEGRNGRALRVLAYADRPADRLQQVARSFAGPMAYRICDWPKLASKPMPDGFEPGTLLGFNLRACPVVRKASAGKYHSAGAEVDAFLSRVWEVDDPEVPVDREEVYRCWLVKQFQRRGGAEPRADSIRLDRFSLERMLRRSGGDDRKSTVIKRPAATLTGRVEVSEPAAFNELLRRGIGRHTGFGFGMLKLRPPGGERA
ncbi:MAG: type I-E CRISPR-associated protein Cas6/Cse3/CasE [Planctomycetota bacterium]